MAAFHINPTTGAAGSCRAKQGQCPFGSAEEHYATAADARQAYEAVQPTFDESGLVWPPPGLPKKLVTVASTADLIRHYNDTVYGGAEGVCLGASAFVSHELIEKGAPHKLIRGSYTDATGEAKAHWWVESSGWIIDASRGQFEEESYRSGVVPTGTSQYAKEEEFAPSHTTPELVQAELYRCFSSPEEADYYLDRLVDQREDAARLFG